MRLARENPWGDTRILGELRNSHLKRAVKAILKAHHIAPASSHGWYAEFGDTERAGNQALDQLDLRSRRNQRAFALQTVPGTDFNQVDFHHLDCIQQNAKVKLTPAGS